MKRVLVIGSKGMAGHVIITYLKELGNFIIADISRNNDYFNSTYNIDITDTGKLSEAIDDFYPDVVVNCIGILNKEAEENPEKAIFINCYLPHFLARKGNSVGYNLIHISTDCVFSGETGGYTETSPKDGTGFYAQSKSLGEINYGNHLTIRTSIIGPELKENGIGLFDWFMRQHGEIKGYVNAYWTGVTTVVLAQAIGECIIKGTCGLHHLVNGEKISKYELLGIMKKVFYRDEVSIIADEKYRVDKSLKIGKELIYEVPSYDLMIMEMYKWMSAYSNIYSRYFK